MINNSRHAKQAMEAKLKELTESRGWRDTIAVEHNADPLDTTQRAVEREMATRGLDRNAALVRQIRAAIGRIDREEYGVCLECEEPISQKRLAAVPWAVLCIRCQEQADRGDHNVEEYLEDSRAKAA